MVQRQLGSTPCFNSPVLVDVLGMRRISMRWSRPLKALVVTPRLLIYPVQSIISNCVARTQDNRRPQLENQKVGGEKQQYDTYSIARRTFLLSLTATMLFSLFWDVKHAAAYSSPYRPGQSGDTNLPKRLFDKPEKEIVYTESGLQYFDLKTGSGSEAKDGSTVSVNYTTRLRGLNGIKVQSTFDDKSAPPFVFRVGDPSVVPGVNEAIVGMRVGGFRRVVVPPNLAYQSPDMKPPVTEFFARRRLLSVLRTNRDATIVFEYVCHMFCFLKTFCAIDSFFHRVKIQFLISY